MLVLVLDLYDCMGSYDCKAIETKGGGIGAAGAAMAAPLFSSNMGHAL